jgi:hypothetical protein
LSLEKSIKARINKCVILFLFVIRREGGEREKRGGRGEGEGSGERRGIGRGRGGERREDSSLHCVIF